MKITLFTSNQPRHQHLARLLADVADELWLIQECNTVFPGFVSDFFKASKVMQFYFSRVMAAESEVFGHVGFLGRKIRSIAIKMGDLNQLPVEIFSEALKSDIIIIFGATFIRVPLVDELVKRRAINIHMGVSPYYRGSSCNFWAMYDGRPDFVGATIHLLTRGLDSGPMLFHAFPDIAPCDPFVYGMKSVKAAHLALLKYIRSNQIHQFQPVTQNKTCEIRYTRNTDFTDEVAADYLQNLPTWSEIDLKVRQRQLDNFLHPYFER